MMTRFLIESRVYLGNRDSTLLGQLLFSLLARVGVTKVGVEVLVQDLRRLLVEVPPLSSAEKSHEEEGHEEESHEEKSHSNALVLLSFLFFLDPIGFSLNVDVKHRHTVMIQNRTQKNSSLGNHPTHFTRRRKERRMTKNERWRNDPL